MMETNKLMKLVTVAFAFCVAALRAELPDPMAWFNMTDVSDGVVRDASGNGHDLTLGRTVLVTDDELMGKVLKVTGKTNDWCTFTCPVVTNMAIALWINRDAADSSVMVGDVEQNTMPTLFENFSGFAANNSRNQVAISLADRQNSPLTALGGVAPARTEWHHLVFSVTYVDEGEFGTLVSSNYVDGALVSTKREANNRAMKPAGSVDVQFLNASTRLRPMSGRFADVRFYDQALSGGQIAEIAAIEHERKLVLRYEFESMSAEADGNGHRTTPETTGLGAVMTLGTNMSLVDDGVEGKALRFMASDGAGGVFRTPAIPIRERTMTVWLRNSSSCTDLFAEVNNPYPRLFQVSTIGGYCQLGTYANLNRTLNFVPSGCGSTTKAATAYMVSDLDVWSHLALVERMGDDGQAKAELYVNGEKIESSSTAYDLAMFPARQEIILGNSGTAFTSRYYCGDMDDVRLYNYALSADEVRRVCRGVAKVSAGDDFTVAGTVGVLRGHVAATAENGYSKGYAGEETSWSLVSAPEGGEEARILQPNATETSVSLPVAGTYVFRFSVSDLGATRSDDVTVTCVANDPSNAAPTLTATVSAAAITRPDVATLTAIVSDDGKPVPAKTRTSWRKKSGPGGVWFRSVDETVTKAGFGAAGAYVLTCTADDGQSTVSSDVTVVVADREDGQNLDSGLVRCWSLDGQANPYFKEAVTGSSSLTAPNYTTLRYLKGKVGNGARALAYSGAGAYFDSGVTLGETAVDDPSYASSAPPANDFLTVSAWVYIDSEDENLKAGRVCGASIVGQHASYGLRYNEKLTPTGAVNTDGFTLFQQGRAGTDATGGVGYKAVHFPAPNPSPRGRWLHVCAISSRNNADSSRFEMWYDGVQQTQKSSFGSARGRVQASAVYIAGMNYATSATGYDAYNANWPDDQGGLFSRTFPGIVDEVRIWTRKLTPEEIRYLAAHPVVEINKGPSVDDPSAATNNPTVREPTQVASVAFADKLPAGGALSYEWSVVEGDAANVSFGDKAAAETTFTARKKGVYVIQLKVSDGERSVYSRPLTFDVPPSGLAIFLR